MVIFNGEENFFVSTSFLHNLVSSPAEKSVFVGVLAFDNDVDAKPLSLDDESEMRESTSCFYDEQR